MSSVSTSGSGAPKSSFSFGRIWDQYGMLVVFAVLFIACAIFVPNFATFINMKGLGLAISMSGMVACGMLFCLASGDFDLSVASVIACAGVTTAVVINLTESLWIGVAAGLLLGVLCGLVNGFVIAKLKINALITTLATMQIYKGIVYVITKGMPITGMPEAAESLANGVIGGILPNIVIIMIVICLLLTLMLKRTKLGRYIYALGGNRNCAKIVGIPTERIELMVYCLSGWLAAIAGILMSCKLASFQASIGESWQMDSITAAVLGGTSMAGGVGSVVGTIIGGILSSVISTCITLLRISSYWETIVTGAVVLIAVLIDAIKDNPVIQSKIKRTLFGK